MPSLRIPSIYTPRKTLNFIKLNVTLVALSFTKDTW